MTGTPSDGATIVYMENVSTQANRHVITALQCSSGELRSIEITYQPIGETVLIAVKSEANLKLPALLKRVDQLAAAGVFET
jgi:hypothetical protein